MIVRKKVSLCRQTGNVIQSEITERVDISDDEYWAPIVKAISNDQEFQELFLHRATG